MLPLSIALAVSFAVTLLLVRSSEMHVHRSADRDFSKPQKFHAVAVPRIGGAGIVLGLGIAFSLLGGARGADGAPLAFKLLACAAPAFLAGFVQDFTEAITPRGRLIATAISAVLAFVWLDAAIVRTDIPGLDQLVSFTAGSLVLTAVAVSGVANAVNIIDGMNGLASMCLVIMLAALAFVAYQLGDVWVGQLALAGIGAVLGFFAWNFPAGLIFLGDGGAYFLGFYFAELSLLLLQRHPGEVSPLFPLLVAFYPIFETLFSIYRRRLLRSVPAHMPDGIHLHSLIYRRVVRWAPEETGCAYRTRRNSMTSPYLWLLCAMSVVPAVLLFDNSAWLAVFLMVFGLVYTWLYWRIVRFRWPRWMGRASGRGKVSARADNRRT